MTAIFRTTSILNPSRTPVPGLLAAVSLLAGCNSPAGDTNKATLQFTSEYQAVFMDNGQVFFGKLEQAGSDYPLLRDAFTLQGQVNPDTKETKTALVRRSVELHNPDYMVLNARHILVIEPVAADSRVAQVIKQAEPQPTAPPKP
ncbi:MAG: hypothetical protein KDI12_23025 [Anaerolineae bacterium]|nr:hypothetical protein [Anaerolineae bacterium]